MPKESRKEDMFITVLSNDFNAVERQILLDRYGITDGKGKSYDELQEIYGIPRDEIKKIEIKLLLNLRKPSVINNVRAVFSNNNHITINDSKKRKWPKRSKRNIYTYFEPYTEEDVDSALDTLTNHEYVLLLKRYGGDLKHPSLTELSSREMKEINESIFEKLLNELEMKEQIDNFDLNFDDLLKILTKKEAIIVALRLGLIEGVNFTTEKIASFFETSIDEVETITKNVLSKAHTYEEAEMGENQKVKVKKRNNNN